MTRLRRILIIDDVEVWRNELVVTLQRNNFYADAVATIDEALELLTKNLYHILILDIRLENNDPHNEDGINFLKELQKRNLSNSMKIIMLSYFEKYMRTTFRDYGVADFLSKGNLNKKTLLESLEEIFTPKESAEEISTANLKINLALETHWQGSDDDDDVVVNLSMNGTSVAKGTEQQHLLWLELDDLLCRLFYEAKSIIILPVTPGQSATGVLSIQPFTEAGGKGTVIVKFGSLDKIQKEYTNFNNYIKQGIGGGRSTTILDQRQTQHLGGLIYSFLGVADTGLEDFGSFYSHASTDAIKKAIDSLFRDTCANWYENKSRLQAHNLTEDYQQLLHLTPERIEQGLHALRASVQRGQRIHFQALDEKRTFSDPIPALINRRPIFYSTYTCITHGDLNAHNILLDKNDNTWLIDFQRTGSGHILRDLSQLDSVVRFELLTEHEATLDERFMLEEALCSIESFQQLKNLETYFSTKNAALAKAYMTVLHVRDMAFHMLGRRTNHKMSEYYTALFYHALNTLRFYDLSAVQREHALLSASLLADRLHLSV